MIIVNNNRKYWEFIRCLRNDKFVQRFLTEKVQISYDEQIKYMLNNESNFKICLDENNTPVGYFRINGNDIGIVVDPTKHKKGYGKFMLLYIKKNYPNAFGKIYINNVASIKLFESCGYKKVYVVYENG